jgi:hypothetical protein
MLDLCSANVYNRVMNNTHATAADRIDVQLAAEIAEHTILAALFDRQAHDAGTPADAAELFRRSNEQLAQAKAVREQRARCNRIRAAAESEYAAQESAIVGTIEAYPHASDETIAEVVGAPVFRVRRARRQFFASRAASAPQRVEDGGPVEVLAECPAHLRNTVRAEVA